MRKSFRKLILYVCLFAMVLQISPVAAFADGEDDLLATEAISALAVSNIRTPAAGEWPDREPILTASPEGSASIHSFRWLDSTSGNDVEMDYNANFEAGHTYTLSYTVKANDGFRFEFDDDGFYRGSVEIENALGIVNARMGDSEDEVAIFCTPYQIREEQPVTEPEAVPEVEPEKPAFSLTLGDESFYLYSNENDGTRHDTEPTDRGFAYYDSTEQQLTLKDFEYELAFADVDNYLFKRESLDLKIVLKGSNEIVIQGKNAAALTFSDDLAVCEFTAEEPATLVITAKGASDNEATAVHAKSIIVSGEADVTLRGESDDSNGTDKGYGVYAESLTVEGNAQAKVSGTASACCADNDLTTTLNYSEDYRAEIAGGDDENSAEAVDFTSGLPIFWKYMSVKRSTAPLSITSVDVSGLNRPAPRGVPDYSAELPAGAMYHLASTEELSAAGYSDLDKNVNGIWWNVDGSIATPGVMITSPAPTVSARIVLVANEGYAFDKNVAATLNGDAFNADSVENLGSMLIVQMHAYAYAYSTYDVTVTNGTGSGFYAVNSEVTVQANPAEAGQKFIGWEGTYGLTIVSGDKTTETITFVMPEASVELMAAYAPDESGEHTHAGTLVEEKAPSCTEDGNAMYYVCECGKYFKDEACTIEILDFSSTILKALGHDTSAEWTTDEAQHWHTCSRCEEKIDLGDHEWNAEAATEQNDKHCTVCGFVAEEQIVHQHAAVLNEAKDPSCVEAGNKAYYTCECGKWFEDEACTVEILNKDSVILAALGHDVKEEWATDAMQHWHECSRCEEKIDLADHAPKEEWNSDESTHWHECAQCGVILDSGNHEWNAEAATEENDKHCTVCGFVAEEKLEHQHVGVLTEGKDASCTEAGNKAYYVCACGKWFEDEACTVEIMDHDSVILSALDHEAKEEWATDENQHWHECVRCEEKLELGDHTWNVEAASEDTDKHCTICGYVAEEKLEHTHQGTLVAEKAANCTENGNKAHYACKCGRLFEDEACTIEIADYNSVVIPAMGHDFKSDWANDSEKHWHECTRCEARGSEAAHTWNVAAATEENDKHCVECGFVAEEKRPHEHKGTYVPERQATCLETGSKAYYICTCGKWYEDAACEKEILDHDSVLTAALGHSYGTPWIGDETNHWHECVRCGDKRDEAVHIWSAPAATAEADKHCTVCGYVGEAIAAHVHKGVLIPQKDPTCLDAGNIAYYKCECGKIFYDEVGEKEIANISLTVLPALGHSITSTWSFDGAQHWHQCSRCNERIDAIAHNWNVPAATTATDKYCTICGFVAENRIPQSTHTHYGVLVNAKQATCTEPGNIAYYVCSCGKWFSDAACSNEIVNHDNVKLAPIDHDYKTAWSSDATYHWYECARCGAKKEQISHVWNAENATADHDKHCLVCGYVAKAKISHVHTGKLVPAAEATVTAAGNKAYYVCECGKWFEDQTCTVEIVNHNAVLIPKLKYEVTEGAESEFVKGSGKTMSFTANGAANTCTGIKVDNVIVSAANYKLKAGSTIVTLQNEYLETLAVGQHSLTILYGTEEATTTFTVKASEGKDVKSGTEDGSEQTPTNTEDPGKVTTTAKKRSAVTPWLIILAIGGAAFGAIMFIKKKMPLGKKK